MKSFYEHFTLKDGRNCELRAVKLTDASALINHLHRVYAQTTFLSRYPEELTFSVEQEETFITKLLQSDKEIFLVAIVEDRLAGCCSALSVDSFMRFAHRCDLGISIDKEFWHLGIGKELLTRVITLAKANGYEQAELEVDTRNIHAVKLYKKLGFETYGTIPHSVKFKDGTYSDYYFMQKSL